MSFELPTPAAQYLRMSTEDQQYSIVNQRACIQGYAQGHGFNIVNTYEDPGRSGVVLKHRKGLSALLRDVVSGEAKFKAILVYDVSRWGRFQNPDEAAHYEFLCASAGIPLHYCAEQFSNDGTASSSVFKALKRSMASEFSRELGDKVFRGKARLAEMGFWMGGPAGYGYRRQIVSENGKRGRVLKDGQQKSLKTDRIILVLGPRKEVEGVRMMFSMAAAGQNCTDIVRALNRMHILIHGREWNDVTVLDILMNPKYTGKTIWNRRTARLHTPLRDGDPEQWIGKPRAFPPIVDQHTFDLAQAGIQKIRDSHWSAEKIIARMRRLLKAKGRLSWAIVLEAKGAPCPTTIRNYFGSFCQLYEALNYSPESRDRYRVAQQRRSATLRKKLCDKIKSLLPDNVEVLLTNSRGRRSILRIDGTFMVSILFCRCETPCMAPRLRAGKPRPGKPRVRGQCWGALPAAAECECITLLCLLNKRFDRCLGFYIVPKMMARPYVRLRRNGELLQRATKLRSLETRLTDGSSRLVVEKSPLHSLTPGLGSPGLFLARSDTGAG
jgi:DNA invertase Pin-like site-specific DNA recombinase